MKMYKKKWLLDCFAIQATEEDELVRDLINEVALSQRRDKDV